MNQRNSLQPHHIDTRPPRIPRVTRRQSEPNPFEPLSRITDRPAAAEACTELGAGADAPGSRHVSTTFAFLAVTWAFGMGCLIGQALRHLSS